MSISEQIEALLADGMLVDFQPVLPGLRLSRRLLLPSEMNDQLRDPDKFPLRYELGRLQNDLERFVSGRPITFGVGKNKACMIKVLDDWDEEVWEIRSRATRPGVRVFGRFAAPNIFVATGMTDRAETDFDIEKRRCKSTWRKLFNTYPPLNGKKPSDYITHEIFDLRTLG